MHCVWRGAVDLALRCSFSALIAIESTEGELFAIVLQTGERFNKEFIKSQKIV